MRTQQQGEFHGLIRESSYTFQDVSGAVWALVDRVGTTYEEAKKPFQRPIWPGASSSCVSEVKNDYFTIAMSLFIQHSCALWDTSTLVATFIGLIGEICLTRKTFTQIKVLSVGYSLFWLYGYTMKCQSLIWNIIIQIFSHTVRC